MGDFTTLLFKEEGSSGTTADDYTSLVFDIRTKREITIRLQNTGASNDLTYRVDSYVKIDGVIAKEEVSATNLAPAAIAEIILPKPAEQTKKIAAVVIQVKSKTPGSSTTYSYEAISGRY